MSFTSTTNYSLQKPDVGTEIDSWGDELNGNLDIISSQMKLNADAAAAASALAGTKASLSHTHDASTVFSGGTVPAAQMPAHTGDVTSPAGSVVNTIAANAVVTAKVLDANITNAKLAVGGANTVKGSTNGTSNTDIPFATIIAAASVADDSITNAKLANMAANTVKGSVAGGDPADLTGAQVLTITGAATTTQLTDAITKEAEVAKTATYVLTAAEVGKMVTFNSASGVNCTINSSVFAAGHRVDVLQLGVGAVTFNGTATRRVFPSSATKLAGQYAGATIWFISATECVIIGNIIV